MIILITAFLYVASIGVLFFGEWRKGHCYREWFRPSLVVCYFTLLSIPALVGVGAGFIDPPTLVGTQSLELASLFGFVAFVSKLVGTRSRIGESLGRAYVRYVRRGPYTAEFRRPLVAGLLLVAVGLALWAILLWRIGGLVFLWQNLAMRAPLTDGLGYLGAFRTWLLISGLALVGYSACQARTLGHFSLWGLVAIVVFAVEVSLGGRSSAVMALFVAVAAVNFWWRKVSPVRLSTAFLTGMIMILIVGWGMLRTYDDPVSMLVRPSVVISDGMEQAETRLVMRLSAIERHSVIVEEFSINRLWWGRGYIDLLYAPIPRRFWAEKPPVDDGTYLRTIAQGRWVVPSMPLSELSRTSWPPGNWVGYMNFHIPGLIVLSFMSGLLVRAVYSAFLISRRSPGLLVLFAGVAWGGGPSFSVYGIVSLGMMALVVWLCFTIAALVDRLPILLDRRRPRPFGA